MRPFERTLRRHLRAHAAAYLVLAVGVAASAAVHAYVSHVLEQHHRARMDALVEGATQVLRDRTDALLTTLRATRALFDGTHEPSREQFRGFVRRLEIQRFDPGVQGIGYVKVVRPGELAAHEQAVRAEGFPDYRVWPAPARGRDLVTSIVYLEPFDWRNRRAFGFDMASEPIRREAMERARDEGVAAATGKVELVQEVETDRQAGFLVYLAVYRGAPATVAERRASLTGFVYAPFRAGDLLAATLGADGYGAADVEILDGDGADPAALLARSGAPAPEARDLARVVHFELAGRPWTLRFTAARDLGEPWEAWLRRGVAVVGIGVSLLLFRVTQGEVRARASAQEAARRAGLLAEAGRILASSLAYRDTLAQVARLAASDAAEWCVVTLDEPEGRVRLAGHRDAAAAADPGAVDAALRDPRAITIPLWTRGEPLGVIAFVPGARGFGAADARLAEDLARLAVAAVDTGRLYRRAQDAVRMRDEFLSIASHELRTPLTSLTLQAESLRVMSRRSGLPDAAARKVEVIRRNVDRLGRLISELLDISRIAEGRLQLELEDVDLGELAREVAGRFEHELERSGCALRLDLEPAVGRWDRLRLDQVITNLLANAVKYGAGQPIEVAVRSVAAGAVLVVRDHGIGIQPDAQARIFERFERAVSDRNYGGFGLGLWIVSRILEALGGTIRVESEPGRGATFTVELPRSAAGLDRTRAPAEQSAARA